MTLYKSLNFKFSPFKEFINPVDHLTASHRQDSTLTAMAKTDYNDINPEFIELLHSHDLCIMYMESFYKKPRTVSTIHLDVDSSSKSKINWVYKGKNSWMSWYQLRPEKDPEKNLIYGFTMIDTPYYMARMCDVTQIDSCKITENPVLVEGGVLHNIFNPIEDRFCLSVTIGSLKTRKNIPMEDSLKILKNFIN